MRRNAKIFAGMDSPAVNVVQKIIRDEADFRRVGLYGEGIANPPSEPVEIQTSMVRYLLLVQTSAANREDERMPKLSVAYGDTEPRRVYHDVISMYVGATAITKAADQSDTEMNRHGNSPALLIVSCLSRAISAERYGTLYYPSVGLPDDSLRDIRSGVYPLMAHGILEEANSVSH